MLSRLGFAAVILASVIFTWNVSYVSANECDWNPDPCNTATAPGGPICCHPAGVLVICTSQDGVSCPTGACIIQFEFSGFIQSNTTAITVFLDVCGVTDHEKWSGPTFYQYDTNQCPLHCEGAKYKGEFLVQCECGPAGTQSAVFAQATGKCICN